MSVKVISYDLKSGSSYNDLYDAIREYDDWCHPVESVWLVKTSDTTSEIRDNLDDHIGPKDKLIVLNLTKGWATQRAGKEINNWLKDNI